ncbi:hypothetical protein L208DRAFT_1514930, partial [Tricholoma matsutake]
MHPCFWPFYLHFHFSLDFLFFLFFQGGGGCKHAYLILLTSICTHSLTQHHLFFFFYHHHRRHLARSIFSLLLSIYTLSPFCHHPNSPLFSPMSLSPLVNPVQQGYIPHTSKSSYSTLPDSG